MRERDQLPHPSSHLCSKWERLPSGLYQHWRISTKLETKMLDSHSAMLSFLTLRKRHQICFLKDQYFSRVRNIHARMRYADKQDRTSKCSYFHQIWVSRKGNAKFPATGWSDRACLPAVLSHPHLCFLQHISSLWCLSPSSNDGMLWKSSWQQLQRTENGGAHTRQRRHWPATLARGFANQMWHE